MTIGAVTTASSASMWMMSQAGVGVKVALSIVTVPLNSSSSTEMPEKTTSVLPASKLTASLPDAPTAWKWTVQSANVPLGAGSVSCRPAE